MRDGTVTPGRVRFRPPWWAWLVTLILLAVMVRLGFWQLDRAEQKRDLQRDFATAAAASPEALAVPAPPADDAPAHVRVRGHYLAAPQFLLDNTALPGHVPPILPGEGRGFQYWFRDPTGGSFGWNYSNAVWVVFAP